MISFANYLCSISHLKAASSKNTPHPPQPSSQAHPQQQSAAPAPTSAGVRGPTPIAPQARGQGPPPSSSHNQTKQAHPQQQGPSTSQQGPSQTNPPAPRGVAPSKPSQQQPHPQQHPNQPPQPGPSSAQGGSGAQQAAQAGPGGQNSMKTPAQQAQDTAKSVQQQAQNVSLNRFVEGNFILFSFSPFRLLRLQLPMLPVSFQIFSRTKFSTSSLPANQTLFFFCAIFIVDAFVYLCRCCCCCLDSFSIYFLYCELLF